MDQGRQKMPVEKPSVRNKNFKEVALGYDLQQACLEADRCLDCRHKPCVKGCPVNIDIPGFIAKVKEHDIDGAYDIIAKTSSLPAICGRVCPQENQCEKLCVRKIKGEAVAIGNLERFVADNHHAKALSQSIPSRSMKVAIIGSGPAGLACANDLAKNGYEVTIYEALHVAGGVLVYGIPEFRLPKAIVEKEIDLLRQLGVTIQTNTVIGKTLTVSELFERGYQAVFIGTGAGLPRFMNIKGEGLLGVFSANEFLTRVNLMKAYQAESATPLYVGKKVTVVGGGNVAMDAARCAKRLGAEVTVIYRRSEAELPARFEEVEHAKEEGIQFRFLSNPVEILKDDDYHVQAIRCEEMELKEPDASGRRKPVAKADGGFILQTDMVIMAIGTSPNPLIKMTTPGLKTATWGGITIDEQGATNLPFVYAGGDAVSGAATVIKAMGAGKIAAKAIDEHLRQKSTE